MYHFIKFIPEFVDLGLPSGLKWAKCNVGAFDETESGKYFQWGDVEGRYVDELKQKPCNWETTPWNSMRPPRDILNSKHDAATVAYGEGYRMPTLEDFKELINFTTKIFKKNYKGSGVNGILFTSKKNGNSIFIPAAGFCFDSRVHNVGDDCYVWSSYLNICYHKYAWYLFFNCFNTGVYNGNRYYGGSVRAVTK